MNSAVKAVVSRTQERLGFILVRCSFFHSTPVLERKRRTRWESRSSHFSRKFRKLQSKQTLLRNVNAYADILFQRVMVMEDPNYPSRPSVVMASMLFASRDRYGIHRWQDGPDNDEPPPGTESWFRSYWTRGSTNERSQKQQNHHHHHQRGFQFCDDDDDNSDVETIFKSAFGGDGFFHWSFIRDEDPPWWRNSRNRSSRYQRFDYRRMAYSDDDYEYSPESEAASSSSSSDRIALGLKASGPLKIEDVKNAYRACALKWHPDRHQGSSKAVAEEKFKICSAAYQSLCDKLAVN